jgi:hypothetical protein
MKLINFKVFILSFLIGVLGIYLSTSTAKKVTVYPTNDNTHLFQFRDKVDNCFQLKQNVVKCSNDSEEIPIQI